MQTKYFLILYFTLVTFYLRAHDQIVHEAITTNAEASAFIHSSAYADFLNAISSDFPRIPQPLQRGAVQSMRQGSYNEDYADQPLDVGGKRSYNHFYDPITGQGMSDYPPDLRVMMGTNSFTWASVSNCPGFNFNPLILRSQIQNINTSNIWSWQNARGYEWLGLTATNQSDRQTNLDNMFRAFGQVMHLLEDTSQPQHVRNEQHLDKNIPVIGTPWLSPIEV